METLALGFAGLLVLSCLAHGISNALNSRNHLREAQALELEEKVSARIDERLRTALAVYRQSLVARGETPPPEKPPAPLLNDEREAQTERRRQRINLIETLPEEDTAQPMPLIGEQPPPGSHIAE